MSIILQTVMVNGLCENKLGNKINNVYSLFEFTVEGGKMCRMSMSYEDFAFQIIILFMLFIVTLTLYLMRYKTYARQ